MKVLILISGFVIIIAFVFAINLITVAKKLYKCDSTIRQNSQVYTSQEEICKSSYEFVTSLEECYNTTKVSYVLLPTYSTKLFSAVFRNKFMTIEDYKRLNNRSCKDYPEFTIN